MNDVDCFLVNAEDIRGKQTGVARWYSYVVLLMIGDVVAILEQLGH